MIKSILSFTERVSILSLKGVKEIHTTLYTGTNLDLLKTQRRMLSPGMKLMMRPKLDVEINSKLIRVSVVEPATNTLVGFIMNNVTDVLAFSVWDCEVVSVPKIPIEVGQLARENVVIKLTIKKI